MVLKVNYKKVITIIPINCNTKQEMEDLFLSPKKLNNYINNSLVIDVSKLYINNNYGIKITVLHIDYILSKYNKKYNDKFIIHLVDDNGNNANKCIITNKQIPYIYNYNNNSIYSTIVS